MRRAVFVFGCALAIAIAAACADDGSDGVLPVVPIVDGGDAIEPSIVGDSTVSAEGEAEIPPGDVCGDRAGLSANAAWPLLGGCPTRAGYSKLEGPRTATVRVLVPFAGGESAPAIGNDDTMWVGSTDGIVYSLAVSGAILRAGRVGGAVRSTPAIAANGDAIMGSSDGKLYRFNRDELPDSGTDDAGTVAGYTQPKLVFALALGPIVSSPVIGPDGTIYVGTTEGKLFAIAEDGKLKWSATTGDTFGSSPALARDGTVYIGSTDRSIHAWNADGSVKWARDLGAEIHGSPAIGGDGSVYIGTVDGKLHSLDASGNVRWSVAAGGPITGTPAVYAGLVYAASEDKKLYALSTADGSFRWAYATLGTPRTPLLSSNGNIHFGSSDGRVYVLTPKGGLFFAVVAKGPVTSAPSLYSGGALYVTTENGITVVGP